MKNNSAKKKSSPAKKLIPAAGSLMVSAVMLATSTYAWFTMNKEVKVTGMEVKAHAEEGLLINEVADAGSNTWDEIATGGATAAVAMRPSSTSDLNAWWHANSKRSYDEAGIDDLSGTVSLANGDKYLNISPAGVSDNAVFASGEGNAHAETHVYYKDATFGTSGSYQDGEGFYVKYTYYLKSSGGDRDLAINNLQVQVKATKNTTGDNASGSSPNLDPALRVGVKMPIEVGSSTYSKSLIFSPIPGSGDSAPNATNTSYSVTQNVSGGSTATVTPVVASDVGEFTAYTTLNDGSAITIPKVTSDGIPVYVYVWYEGEDTHCMSDNLTAALAAYDIDISFKDADDLY